MSIKKSKIQKESTKYWQQAILDASELLSKTSEPPKQRRLRFAMEVFQKAIDSGSIYPSLEFLGEDVPRSSAA